MAIVPVTDCLPRRASAGPVWTGHGPVTPATA